MADSGVQIPQDQTGKVIDMAKVLEAERNALNQSGDFPLTNVYRQTITLGDANNPQAKAAINPTGELAICDEGTRDLLFMILLELRQLNTELGGGPATI